MCVTSLTNSPYLFVFPVSEPHDESWNNDHNWAQSVTCEIYNFLTFSVIKLSDMFLLVIYR